MTLALSTSSAVWGCLAVSLVLGALVAHLWLRSAGAYLVELCRGEVRGRFWLRFLAIALVAALAIGVFVASQLDPRVGNPQFFPPDGPALLGPARMLRLAVKLGGFVALAASLAVIVLGGSPQLGPSTPERDGPEPRDETRAQGKRS